VSFARRVQEIEPFLAVEVAERAAVLERAGVDVVHLEYGEPDFEAPAVVRDALEKAVKDGRMRYTHSLGILPLREAIVEHYAATYGVTLTPEQILVTPGTSPAMLLLFGHLLNAGDEVILSNPYYACYPNFVRYAEGVPVYVDVDEADGFQYRPERIARRMSARTRAIVVNSPANPTGAILTPERMAAVSALAHDGGPMIVSDEIYHGLTEGERDHSILEFTHRAFVLNGFSKAFAMTGWRLGWIIAPPAHTRALQRLHGNFFISTNEFVQWAAVAALREAGAETVPFAQVFAERRRAMIAGLRAIGLGVAFEPRGAFYILADARRYTRESVRFAYEILDGCHVAVTPGAAFGSNAEGYLRFSYAASLPRIEEGLRRLGAFLSTRS
jgi:aspartate/methionine/tyrosine aminotransferase